jgi:hypothetical protein
MRIVEESFYVSEWTLEKQIIIENIFINNTLATVIMFYKADN